VPSKACVWQKLIVLRHRRSIILSCRLPTLQSLKNVTVRAHCFTLPSMLFIACALQLRGIPDNIQLQMKVSSLAASSHALRSDFRV